MTLVAVSTVAKYFAGEPVFRDVSFTVGKGSRIGVVGQNGEGKTTLLRLVSGALRSDAGDITRYGEPSIGTLDQDPVFDGRHRAIDVAMESFGDLVDMEQRMRQMEEEMSRDGDPVERERLLNRYGALMTAYEDRGGYDMEARARETLAGLGFSGDDLERLVGSFSGGEKVRLALAQLLLAAPDLLLLDEPTNHLDLGSSEWLEEFLAGYGGAVMVVSHDRYFLDRVADEILEVHRGRVEQYGTNYTGYLEAREERRQQQLQAYQRQQEEIERLESFIRRYRAGQRYREAQGRQKRLDRMERIERPPDYRGGMGVDFPLSRPSGREVLQVDGLTVKRGDLTICSDIQLRVYRGDRIGLLGPNGSGKTSLLRALLGQVEPEEGQISWGTGVTWEYFPQDLSGPDDEATVLQEMYERRPLDLPQAREYLARFGFREEDVFSQVSDLSGGERSRLLLAQIALGDASLLVLDEPTNHLDLEARSDLERSFASYRGTVIFVSHDRYFMDRVATKLWILQGGELEVFDGNYSLYRETLEARRSSERESRRTSTASCGSPDVKRTPGSRVRQERRPGLSEIEEEIEALEEEQRRLGDRLGDPGSYAGGRGKELAGEFDRVQRRLRVLYQRWEDIGRAREERQEGS